MGWTPRPRWHAASGRWYAAIGPKDERGRATPVYAPSSIARKDEAGAWRWFEATRVELATLATTVEPARSTRDLAERYLEAVRDAVVTRHWVTKRGHLRRFVAAFPKLEGLTVETVSGWIGRLDQTAHSRSNLARTVRAAFRWAAKSGLLRSNPLEGLRAPTPPRAPERFASRSEAAVWLWWLRRVGCRTRPEVVQMTRVMIRSGARPGELCDTRWGDVKWDAGTTSAGHRYAKVVIPHDRHKTGAKTGRPRVIYFTPILTRMLARHRDRGKGPRTPQDAIWTQGRGKHGGGARKRYSGGPGLSQTVRDLRLRLLADREAALGKLERGDPVTSLERALAAVAFEPTGPNRLVNYRWRHTAISSLLMMGVDVATVAELHGTSVEMVRRHYGHLLDAHLAAAAERMIDVGRTRSRRN